MNSYYYRSPTSHNSCLSIFFLYMFCIRACLGDCFVLRLHFLFCVCVCVYTPVRELEIEPCNKRCAFPDRIAETLTSSSAALPKNKDRR